MTTPTTPAFPSRLPNVGTTIFTVMSALAAQHKAVNLGQGFPDFDCDPKLVDGVADAMRAAHNQYPPMPGVPALREAIAGKIAALYGHTYDAHTEITVTAGATQAILTAILCCVGPGDEVIVLEPCYDSYVPNIELTGASLVRVPLTPGTFRPDFGKIAAALSPRTRAIIINTPHNPSGTVWTPAEMQRLQDLLAPTNVLVISDEVYEHMVYAPLQHESVARYPGLAARSFIISSFGKTYHVTGWKVGYVAAPAALSPRTRAIIINSPHNPSGTVWTPAEMQHLQELLAPTNVLVISDEVYEHMVYAPLQHESVARYPGLAARSFIISSFGKTYHVTGWKVGYVAAPAALTAEFRKVHQFCVFTVNTPMQVGLASYMQDPAPYLQLPAFYAAKRDLFREGLAATQFRLLPCEGTYFQCVAIDGLGVPERDLSEADFCQWLTREIGVAAIPLSAFYGNGFDQKVVRFCFAKKDETLRAALGRLARL